METIEKKLKNLAETLKGILVFLSIPLALIILLTLYSVYSFSTELFQVLETLKISNVVQIVNQTINNESVFSSLIIPGGISLILSYIIYVFIYSQRNPTVLDADRIEIVEDLIASKLITLVNIGLPVVITILLSQPYELTGLSLLACLAIVAILIELIPKTKGNVFIAINIALSIGFFYFNNSFIKEAILISLIFLISKKILKNAIEIIRDCSKNYEKANNYIFDDLMNEIKSVNIKKASDDRNLVLIARVILTAIILELSKYINWSIYSLFGVGIAITYFSIVSSFTVILPIYYFLMIPLWIKTGGIIKSLTKDKVDIKLNDGEVIKNAIILQQDFKRGLLKCILKKDRFVTVPIGSISKIIKK